VEESFVEAVLSTVEGIPPGRVSTYGAIADVVGSGPRLVGRVMALYGAPVPWWRVVRADGTLPPSHHREALARYREEATPLRGRVTDAATLRVDLVRAFWSPPSRPPMNSLPANLTARGTKPDHSPHRT
jgi:alkylated DNA nucleotide flippase Atl1